MVTVCVWMTTYNHEDFIAQAIEGVLMQQTNFTYELVIGEDCSTDRTREIVLDYKAKYPDKIRLFLPDKNLGMIGMAMASVEVCDGKYIAILDGDDYWADPLKLQKQVDFMEANPGYALCFHSVKLLDHEQGTFSAVTDNYNRNLADTLLKDDFISIYNPVYTLSALYRTSAIGQKFPDWFTSLPFLDLGIHLLLVKNGKARYMRETMGVYRIHNGGVWTSESVRNNYLRLIDFWQKVQAHLEYLDKNKIDSVIAKIYLKLVDLELKEGNIDNAKAYFKKVWLYDRSLLFSKKMKCLKVFLYWTIYAFRKTSRRLIPA